ncbi:TPA: LysR substrate-binding domain-containing protein [Klebsiella pneumoniae]
MAGPIPALYALRAFEVAARHCSFSRAAQELSLSQSAISHHIKTLETQFACPLFERNGPRLTLTTRGRALADELKVGFRIIENACALLRTERNVIRLKAPPTLTIRWLLKALDSFSCAGTRCNVQLSSVWMDIDTVDFYAEPYDCAILLGNGEFTPDIEGFKLFDEWLIPVCQPGYLGAEPPTLAQLDRCQLLHASPDRRDWRRWLDGMGARSDVVLERGQLFDSLEQGMAAAGQGLGVATVDLALVSAEVARGQLHFPFPSAVATGDGYYMSWLKSSPAAVQMRQLRDHLLIRLPTLPADGIDYRGA